MGLADELEKLQRLKLDGVLTEDEFTQAKQKLLEDDTPEAAPPPPPQTIKLSLKEGLDEIVDEESTLGQAANRYVDYKTNSMLISGVIFIVIIIIFAIIFANAKQDMDRSFRNNFPGSSPWTIGR
jgi:hypothetical protein